MGGVESIAQTDDTHSHWVTKVGGVTREFDTEITEQHPDERVAWKSTDGTTHAGVVTFHRLGEGQTKVTVQLDWQADGIVEKAGALIGVDDHQVKPIWTASRPTSNPKVTKTVPGAATSTTRTTKHRGEEPDE